jgi:hypothetical protein
MKHRMIKRHSMMLFLTSFGLLFSCFGQKSDNKSTVLEVATIEYTGYFEWLSNGFNAREYLLDYSHITAYEYYLLNNPNYSNAMIESFSPPITESNNNLRYEIYQKKNDDYHGSFILDLLEEDSKYIIWGFSLKEDQPERIVLGEGSMTFVYSDGGTVKYYNIPEHELENKYLTEFVGNIRLLFSEDSTISYFREEYVQRQRYSSNMYTIDGFMGYLPHFTKEELAIIRNCLFAKHGYAFQNSY